MLIQRLLPLIIASALLHGCATAPSHAPLGRGEARAAQADTGARSFFPFSLWGQADEEEESEPEYALDDRLVHSGDLKSLLYSQFKEWRAVRYKLGGLSKRGIDCSGFVYLTYRDKLGVKLPRIARDQSKVGRSIRQAELKPGDLVFFQVDRWTRHVGIYLEDRKFMHASAKKGITISSLDNRYWSKRYWKSVRVPEALVAMGMN